jgi:phosphoglycolate phosphatase-like HAD superfamily hydrolase
VCERLGAATIESDWATYPDVTDSGILWTLWQSHRGCPPTASEVSRIQSRFVELLHAELSREPSLCVPLPGAAALLADLLTQSNYAIGMATGGWRESAELKLRHAKLIDERIPLATSSDEHSREAILQRAYERVAELHGVSSFESVVYVGDGVWDGKAARRLGYHFVGIGKGAKAEQLRQEGAVCVMADYTDRELFYRAIATAFVS